MEDTTAEVDAEIGEAILGEWSVEVVSPFSDEVTLPSSCLMNSTGADTETVTVVVTEAEVVAGFEFLSFAVDALSSSLSPAGLESELESEVSDELLESLELLLRALSSLAPILTVAG